MFGRTSPNPMDAGIMFEPDRCKHLAKPSMAQFTVSWYEVHETTVHETREN